MALGIDGGIQFYIDIEDAAGRVGAGPIVSASAWRYTARMDKAGSFSFDMPAYDDKAELIQRKRKARAWAKIGGAWVEVGAGIIDRIERRVRGDGAIVLSVSGDDELRELSGRSVGWLDLSGGGSGLTHAAAIALVAGTVATGWTFVPSAAPGNDYIYGRFAGESVLSAMIGIADKTETHFYRSGPRALTFASAFTSSGVRAIRAGVDGSGGDLDPETAAITDLHEEINTYSMITRIVPLGAGNGETRLTLAPTIRTAPAGYTLNIAANYLQHDGAVATYGVLDAPWIEFKDIRPISNTDGDLRAAANMLFDQALKELKRRALALPVATYDVELAGCSQLLHPLQSLRLTYRDEAAGIDVDQDVNILAATWEVDSDGVQTTAVELSTSDLWPQNDVDTVVERIMEGTVYQAHPQLNANAYVLAFSKNIDEVIANPAQFRFRFDQEVTQLTRVCFDFQLLPLESTVKSVGATSGTSEASGDHSHSVTIGDHTHSITLSSHQHGVTIASHQHTIPNHQHRIGVSQGSGGRGVGLFTGGGFYYDGTDVGVVSIFTTTDSGGTTSNSGGGSSPTSDAGGATSTTSGNGGATTGSSVSGGSHSHTVSPTINTVYGVYRDSPSNMFTLADLEYSVDNATWYVFTPFTNGFEDLGDGWYRIDITSILQNTVTLRPLAANNLLQIRRKVGAPMGKLATIDAQLSVRTIIQAIAFTQ